MNKLFITQLIIVGLISISCKENLISHEKFKDPREYLWNLDTIKYPPEDEALQSYLGSIWGSDENNVYITGHADSGNRVFNYNGKNWVAVKKGENFIPSAFNGEHIWGFGNNDVWIAGQIQASLVNPAYPNEVPGILHYNGSQWKIFELETTGRFWFIWGKNSNSIYACGDKSTIGYFDGTSFHAETIPLSVTSNQYVGIRSIIEYNNMLFAIAINFPKLMLISRQNGKWSILDSVTTTYLHEYPWGEGSFFITSNNKLWSYGAGGIWEYNNDNSWSKIINTELSVSGIVEFTKNNFIVTDFNGKLYYYTQGNLNLLQDFGKHGNIYGVWANEKQCFVLMNKQIDGFKSISFVINGK